MVVSKTRSRETGPLEPFRSGFGEFLVGQGYAPKPVELHLAVFSQLSRWLGALGLAPRGLSLPLAEVFFEERRAAGYAWHTSVRSLWPLLGYLASVGVVIDDPDVGPPSPAEELIGVYVQYLRQTRGLTEGSIDLYLRQVRRVVTTWWPDGNVAPDQLGGQDVIEVVRGQVATLNSAGASTLLCALRSFLRFLQATGRSSAELLEAVPALADRRRDTLPRWVGADVVARMLAACDVGTAAGRRDRAILLVLARLGLRAGEVAALRLDDIDWVPGEVVVTGKGPRVERLPLPVDVGEAIVAYLLDGRPATTSRGLFVAVDAPHGALTRGAVKSVTYRACDRAGLDRVGPHRLRHTVATQTLRAGAPLDEVAQLLRHRRVDTTLVYAKVDGAGLAMLARPWPGASR